MSDGEAREGGRDALGELLGFEHLGGDGEVIRARVPVAERLLQPFGLVHGGVYPALAETVCSKATYEAVAGSGMIAVGQANHATFLHPVSEGHVNAAARPRHRGRSSWVWEVELSDDEGRLCALVLVTIAVRPAPSATGSA